MGASSFSPSPMTTTPSMWTRSSTACMPSTARLVGRLLVPHADPRRAAQRGGLRDPHELEGEVAVGEEGLGAAGLGAHGARAYSVARMAEPGAPDLRPGEDGRLRCAWATSAPEYVAYHDEEWGRPVRDADGLFERLTLEAFQSGLSWLTILRKRAAFRAAFAGFAIDAVAAFGPADVERLLGDAGIVRNRAKIEAAIANARAAAARGRPRRAHLVVRARAPRAPRRAALADVPAITDESRALAKELKRRGFRFVGPTTAYALMQACGLVDDHLEGCWARA